VRASGIGTAVCALMAGCASAPIIRPVEVQVPVPVPCVSSIPASPVLTHDGELRTMTDYQFVLALRRNELLLKGHVAELEAVLTACAHAIHP
jgi:hypothetical protein